MLRIVRRTRNWIRRISIQHRIDILDNEINAYRLILTVDLHMPIDVVGAWERGEDPTIQGITNLHAHVFVAEKHFKALADERRELEAQLAQLEGALEQPTS